MWGGLSTVEPPLDQNLIREGEGKKGGRAVMLLT